jgi:hypothetical protein
MGWERAITVGAASNPVVLDRGACAETNDRRVVPANTVLLFIGGEWVDGPGNVIARAGPCAVDPSTGLPVAARLVFDAADSAAVILPAVLETILRHELAHALGFGTLWEYHHLLVRTRGDDLAFTGQRAAEAFVAIGGSLTTNGSLPVDGGRAGIPGMHWPEAVFRTELMTPSLITSRPMPLSIVTLASLEDLGYIVDRSTADSIAITTTLENRIAHTNWNFYHSSKLTWNGELARPLIMPAPAKRVPASSALRDY